MKSAAFEAVYGRKESDDSANKMMVLIRNLISLTTNIRCQKSTEDNALGSLTELQHRARKLLLWYWWLLELLTRQSVVYANHWYSGKKKKRLAISKQKHCKWHTTNSSESWWTILLFRSTSYLYSCYIAKKVKAKCIFWFVLINMACFATSDFGASTQLDSCCR